MVRKRESTRKLCQNENISLPMMVWNSFEMNHKYERKHSVVS